MSSPSAQSTSPVNGVNSSKRATKNKLLSPHQIHSNTTKEQPIPNQERTIHDLVYAPSAEIEAIASKLIIRDLGYIIEYLKQKINLEQRYTTDLNSITKNLQKVCGNPDQIHGIQKSFMDYVGLADTNKVMREEYVKNMKGQCDILTKVLHEQQKSLVKIKTWMAQENQKYLVTRLKKLPAAREIYQSKWDEIERTTGSSTLSPMILTPTLSVGSTLNSSLPNLSNSEELDQSFRAASLDDDRAASTTTGGSTPPLHQAGRIERFMKKRLNKHEDLGAKNIRIAKLKVDANEADIHYRSVIRELSTLSLTVDATNHHILRSVQASLKEKSKRVKELLEFTLKADLDQLQQNQIPALNLLSNVQHINVDEKSRKFSAASSDSIRKFPKPVPIYYNNHHVGICKDLIFGTSLKEYAQQRKRSPPLLITKCIETIERLGGLEKEGIYRVSGKQSTIEKIKHAFEQDEAAVEFGHNDVPEDLFSTASVIKIFLRELGTPLFPFKLADRLEYSQIPDAELRLMNLLTRLIKLEPANYDTLKALVHHLAKLQACVDKNKMTTTNLTLIFTPAIFQDLNQAQITPGEWAKDCVLEDLILHSKDVFANRDLHNNSAITGHIEYGFDKNGVAGRTTVDRYALTIQSPDSPTGQDNDTNQYSYTTEANNSSSHVFDSVHDKVTNSSNDPSLNYSNISVEQPLTTAITPPVIEARRSPPLPLPRSSPPPLPRSNSNSDSISTTSRSSSVERKKYQTHFQGMGLKLDTGVSIGSNNFNENQQQPNSDHIIPTIQSAIEPSYNWLNDDPEEAVGGVIPNAAKLRRSATTGKKVLSRRKQQDGVPIVPPMPLLNRSTGTSGAFKSSTATIP